MEICCNFYQNLICIILIGTILNYVCRQQIHFLFHNELH